MRALSPVPDASQRRGEPRRFGAVWRVEVVSFCEDLEFEVREDTRELVSRSPRTAACSRGRAGGSFSS